MIDSPNGWVVGGDGVLVKTADNGVTWLQVRVRGAAAGPDFLAIKTLGTGAQAIVVGTNGMVYLRTANRFDPVNLGAQAVTVNLNDVAVLNGGANFVAVGDEGTILSFDGTTWTQPKSQTNEPLLFASFDALNHGFVVGREFMILEFR